MTYFTEIGKDRREIFQVHKAGDPQVDDYRVGDRDFTKIEVYEDNGPACMLPFVAVYRGDHLFVRVPAINLCIYYKEPTQ